MAKTRSAKSIEQMLQQSPSSGLHNDNEDAWEDINDDTIKVEPVEVLSTSPSATGFSTRSNPSPRRRKSVHRTAHTAAPFRKPATPPTVKQPRPLRNVIMTEDIVDGALNGASFTVRYAFDIFNIAIRLLRWPLYLLVFLWLLALVIGRISSTLRGAFSPLCFLPGLYGSRVCHSTDLTRSKNTPRWADYSKLVDIQTSSFEHLLDESVGGSGLSLEIKKAEMATTDLVVLVRVSNLHSREVLGDTLVQFVDDAKKTSKSLQKLSSRVGGAVDSIMAVNDYALHTIEEAHLKAPSRFSLQALAPWEAPRPLNEVVTETFQDAMSVLSTAMKRLILEAEVNLANLDKLEERLSVLHELVSREDLSLSVAKSELLSDLWTKLGGNRRTLRGYDDHLILLKNLGGYRKRALAHVVAALQTLQSMSTDMEDMRERVAAPELTGSKIPVEVHMKSIKGGLERLKEGRIRARKLEEEAMRSVLGIEADVSDSRT